MLETASTSASCGRIGIAAELVQLRLVHEARVEVADLAVFGAGSGVFGLGHNLLHGVLGRVSEHREGAPACLVARDLGALEPLRMHVHEEVVAGADVGCELVCVDS